MRFDIVLCCVGGQGGISVSALIARAALARGLSVKQSEIHGMAQRGGEVLAQLRLADKPVASPIVPRGMADLILAFEPLEALRYLSWLAPGGAVVSAIAPVPNVPDYPPIESVLDELRASGCALLVDAAALAKEAGDPRTANVALLGAAAARLPVPAEGVEDAIRETFGRKGAAVVEANLRAFEHGRAASR